jgi:hypothetical protein
MMMNFNRRRTMPSSSTSSVAREARSLPCPRLEDNPHDAPPNPAVALLSLTVVVFLQNMVITVVLPTMVVKVNATLG